LKIKHTKDGSKWRGIDSFVQGEPAYGCEEVKKVDISLAKKVI